VPRHQAKEHAVSAWLDCLRSLTGLLSFVFAPTVIIGSCLSSRWPQARQLIQPSCSRLYQTTVIHQRTPHSLAVLAQEPGECFLLVQHAARAKPVSDVRQIPAQNLVVALSLKPAMHGFLILRVGNRLAARASFRNVPSGNYAGYARIPNRSPESSNIYSSGPWIRWVAERTAVIGRGGEFNLWGSLASGRASDSANAGDDGSQQSVNDSEEWHGFSVSHRALRHAGYYGCTNAAPLLSGCTERS
jgi:hypothetical protein